MKSTVNRSTSTRSPVKIPIQNHTHTVFDTKAKVAELMDIGPVLFFASHELQLTLGISTAEFQNVHPPHVLAAMATGLGLSFFHARHDQQTP
ncbi:hypothetical protein GX48_01496 [Paracoccidioides brasiliensis]|nr:hypothetical protein GX48_01496 [Paracoccidioides brasiliensis]